MDIDASAALLARARGKAFIKVFPQLVEQCLITGDVSPFEQFDSMTDTQRADAIVSDTISAELGSFSAFWVTSSVVRDGIYLPKYYDEDIRDELEQLSNLNDLVSVGDLVASGALSWETGDEIGKAAYGTGDIPFLRTSDFSNWEILHNPKQGISTEIFEAYNEKQDLRPLDILLVRDGTYLVGSSTLVTADDSRALYCGGLIRIRVSEHCENVNAFLILGLLNSYIVKRQLRARQFTRDVIDTLGKRLDEVILPIPRDPRVRSYLSQAVRQAVDSRIDARRDISQLANAIGDANN